MHHEEEPTRMHRTAPIAMWVLGTIALFYLVSEHQAHVFGALPFLLILACPLMHLFMHRGHHHGHDQPPRDDDRPSSHEH